jgi:hypothetical protein
VNIKIKDQKESGMLFYIKGIIHYKFIPPKQSIRLSTYGKDVTPHLLKKDQILVQRRVFCIITMHYPIQHFW